jgi:hypothetical protein
VVACEKFSLNDIPSLSFTFLPMDLGGGYNMIFYCKTPFARGTVATPPEYSAGIRAEAFLTSSWVSSTRSTLGDQQVLVDDSLLTPFCAIV